MLVFVRLDVSTEAPVMDCIEGVAVAADAEGTVV